MSRLMQRRIRQLKSVYEQAGDVDVLLEFLQAENRAYVRAMLAQRQARALSPELRRSGNQIVVHALPAFCQRRADYLRSLCEGVLGRPVTVSIQHQGCDPGGACRIALCLPV